MNRVSLVASNQNAPHPQYGNAMPVDPYGTVPRGYPFYPFPPPDPRTEFENPRENPCSCCCGLVKAAKNVVILNLLYLCVELVDSLARNNPFAVPLFFLPGAYYFQILTLFRRCVASTGPTYNAYIALLIFLTCAKLAYVVATCGFWFAVFSSPETKKELLWSNIFMWVSFLYAGSLLLGRILLPIIIVECNKWIGWGESLLLAMFIAIFPMLNGLVGRGFRNMVRRRSLVLPPKIGEEVPQ